MVREESDMKDSDFIQPHEFIRLINEHITNLRGLIIASLGHVSLYMSEVTLTQDSEHYVTLPDDVLVIKKITLKDSKKPLFQASLLDEDYGIGNNFHGESYYVLVGNKAKILYGGEEDVKILYSSAPPYLVNLTDTIDVIFNEDQVITLLAAKEILRREETSLVDIEKSIDTALKILMKVLAARTRTGPKRITDTRRRSDTSFRSVRFPR